MEEVDSKEEAKGFLVNALNVINMSVTRVGNVRKLHKEDIQSLKGVIKLFK